MLLSSFNAMPPDPQLKTNEIHVYCASMDECMSSIMKLNQLLSTEEKLRAKRFHFEKDSQRFIVRHGILRKILARYLYADPGQLKFSYTKNKKPVLFEAWGRRSIRFNTSHSEGIVLYAVTRGREIGIDIEYNRDIPEIDQIAEQFFSENENLDFQALPQTLKTEAFFNCWTRKEAFIKATGDGMYRPLQEFDVSLVPGEPARLMHVRNDPQAVSHWTIQDLKPVWGFTAALAVERRIRRLWCWNWANVSFTHKLLKSRLERRYINDRCTRN